MNQESPESGNLCPASVVARLDDYRHRQRVREARRVFRAFEAAVWEHIRLMVEHASEKPRRPHPELVVNSDASGEPR